MHFKHRVDLIMTAANQANGSPFLCHTVDTLTALVEAKEDNHLQLC